MDGEIFKIKPVGKGGEVVLDKRKTVSPFNSAKHLKSANIPALCDQCVYKSIDDGGNGKCPKYEKGAVCAIREDFVKFINELDTRQPEDVKAKIYQQILEAQNPKHISQVGIRFMKFCSRYGLTRLSESPTDHAQYLNSGYSSVIKSKVNN